MSEIAKARSKQQVMIQNQKAYLEVKALKVESEKDIESIINELANANQLVATLEVEGAKYIILQAFVPAKVEIARDVK